MKTWTNYYELLQCFQILYSEEAELQRGGGGGWPWNSPSGNSYELMKVLVSDTAAYTGLNSWKIFQLMLFQGRTRSVFKSLNDSEKIPVYL